MSEERGFEVMLVDPRRIKNVSGRKTDVLDCQWLQQLHTYGLLSGAFRPEAEIRRLRSYLRHRAMLVEYASHHIQHMQKALTQMNVKLQHVISNITGKTGMDIIEAIVKGERDPQRLARFRRPGVKVNEATIVKSLQGHWREEHIFELTQALELYRFYQGKIAECDGEIEAQLERFEDRSDGGSPGDNGRRQRQGNAPRLRRADTSIPDDWGRPDPYRRHRRLHRPEGDQRDWHRHDQMAQRQAFRLLAGAEPGPAHHRRPSDQLKDQTQRQPCGGRVASGRQCTAPLGQRPGRLPAAEEGPNGCAQGHHRHGPQVGQARLLHAAAYGQEYVDAGAEYYERQYQQRALRAAKRRAAQLGYQLIPMSDAPEYAAHAPPGAPIAA